MGKFSFFLSLGFYICLLLLNYPEPNMGGDNAMGYGLGLAFLGLGFGVSSIGLFVGLAQHGVFGYFLKDIFWKNFLAIAFCLAFILTVFFSAVFKWESSPEMVTFVEDIAKMDSLIWIPMLVLIPSFLVFFQGKDLSFPFVKISFSLGFLISIVFSFSLLVEWIFLQNEQQKEMIASVQNQNQEQHDRYLQEIEELDSAESILLILPFSGRFHEEDVKSAAVSKIRSRPDWESELIGILVSESNYHYAYSFLDGNMVDHPELFTEPVRLSMLQMASDIRNSITDSNNLQGWQFEYLGIERLLRVIDGQLAGQGMDFYPAMLEVRKALDTSPPERFKGVKYNVTPLLDNWLKKNAK